MPIDFELHPGFDAGRYMEAFQSRGWNAQTVKVGNFDMVVVDEDSAVECGDGRFGKRVRIKKYGPKLMGGSNFIAAAKSGGSPEGFEEAAQVVKKAGYRPGFHRGCAFYEEWAQGRLRSVRHQLIPPRYDPGLWVRSHAYLHNGKHFKDIEGLHEEEDLVFNPCIGITPRPNPKRFGHDQGLAVRLGVDPDLSLNIAAEVVEKVSSCRRVTILIT